MITANQKCPLCKSNGVFIFRSKIGKDVFHCSNHDCSHIFTPLLNSLQGVCSRAEDIEAESNLFLKRYERRNTRLLKLFLKKLSPKKSNFRMLDFGAGNAHVSRTFLRKLPSSSKIFCIDLNPNCKVFYSKFGLDYYEKIDTIPSNLDVDLIYLIEVIEHLVDPIDTLITLSNKFPNAKIFISTPLGKFSEINTIAFDNPSHLHFFTKKSLAYCITKAGLINPEFLYYPELYPTASNVLEPFIFYLRVFKNFLFTKMSIKSNFSHLTCFVKKSF